MASIAVLPVLVGLAVDYAIQFQSRVGEELEQSRDATHAGAAHGLLDGPDVVRRAAALGGPTIATAAAASAAAMLVLTLSPVPMVRGFGVLLVVGVAIALLCAFSVGAAAISLSAAQAPDALGARRLVRQGSWPPAGGARASCCREPAHPADLAGGAGRARCATRRACCAWGWRWPRSAGGSTRRRRVETDITKLVPQNLSSLQNLNTLERTTGVGGEIDLMVEGRNLTKPATIEWMIAYQSAVLARFGYSSGARLRPGAPVPRVLAARPVPGPPGGFVIARTSSRRRRSTACWSDPAVLLPGRDHARPRRGDDGLRDPPDGPRPSSSG